MHTTTAELPCVRLATHAMGTRFELLLFGDDAQHLRAAGEEAIEEIERWHTRLSRFDRASLVSRINEAEEGQAVRVDPETFALFAVCDRVNMESGGAFGVARHGGVTIDGPSCTVTRHGDAAIDLGGVGKGFGVDRAVDVLRDHEIQHAMLHGGTSTIAAIGTKPDGSPWRIVVESPPGSDDRVFALADTTLSVSSRAVQGSHIVDARTGERLDRDRVAVCLGGSAAEADAWSTALFVLGHRPAGAGRGVEMVQWDQGAWDRAPTEEGNA